MNTLLGTVALALAGGIVAWSASRPDDDLDRKSRSTSRAAPRTCEGPVFNLAWSPDGRRLAASGFDPVIRIWKVESRRIRGYPNASGKPRFVLGWSEDGAKLIVGGMDVPVESWEFLPDEEDGDEVFVRPVEPKERGRCLAEHTLGRSIRFWGPADGRLALLPPSGRKSNTAAFSTDGRWIASGDSSGALRVWDLGLGLERKTRPHDSRGINSVAFSPDGSKLVSAGGGPIRVWDVESGEEVMTLGERGNGTVVLAFPRDGGRLAAAMWDGTIRIWDLSGRREVRKLIGHGAQIPALAWSPDGKSLASGGYDSVIRIWNVEEATVQSRSR